MKDVSKSKKKNMKKKKINSLGFTLIELLATIAILSIVISIVVYFAIEIVGNAKSKSYQVTISNIEQEVSSYVLEETTSWIDKGTYQYQCVTVQDLIDLGYFKGDVLESKVDDNRNVLSSDRVYLERDSSTKAITKNILLVLGYESYTPLCDHVPINGQIKFNVSPDDWSKDKNIIIEYTIKGSSNDDFTYGYSYEANNEDNNISLVENTFKSNVEVPISVNDNGQLTAIIKDNEGNTVISDTLWVNEIDNDAPIVSISSTNNVASSQIATLTMRDDKSGIDKYYFGQDNDPSDDEFIDVENKNSITENSNVDKDGKWYLVVEDAAGNKTISDVIFYKTTLSISNGSVSPNVILTMSGNSFMIPNGIANSGYTFIGWYDSSNRYVINPYKPLKSDILTGLTSKNDVPIEDKTPPTIQFSPNGSGWVKSITSTIIATDSSGVSTLMYNYSDSETNNALTGTSISSGYPYTFSGVTGEYYLHAYACDSKNNCDMKSSNPFYIDNTKPTVSISSTNNVSNAQTVRLIIGDSDSGLQSYSWGNISTSLSGNPSSQIVEKTIFDPGTYNLIATDAVGNSNSTSITFYETTLVVNGSVVSNIITKSGNSFPIPSLGIPNGYTLTGWKNGSGTKVANAGGSYTPTSSTTLYAILTSNTPVTPPVVTPTDTTKPTITFNPDGSGWVKSITSSISATDSSGISMLRYAFSQSPSFDFNNGVYGAEISPGYSYTFSNKTGTYYLHAYACDNASPKNCTNADSNEFKLDNTPPTVSIISTNNIADSQSVTLTMSDAHSGLASYSWGSLSPTKTNLSGNPGSKTVTETIGVAGTFSLSATDSVGNTSNTESVTFYKTTLSISNGSVSPSNVLTMKGNSFPVPTPTVNSDYEFKGWYDNASFSGSAITTYTPTGSTTLYAKVEKKAAADMTPPTITISPNGSVGYVKSITSSISATDSSGISILRYAYSQSPSYDFNDGAYGTAISSGYSYTFSNKTGTYYLHAYACDNASPKNCTTKSSNPYYLDNTPPVLSISNPYNSKSWYNKASKEAGLQYKLTLNATEKDSGIAYYEYKIGSTGSYVRVSNCSGSTCYTPAFTNNSNGGDVYVRVYDKAGNFDEGTTNIFIDVTPPVVECNASGAYVIQTIDSPLSCSYESRWLHSPIPSAGATLNLSLSRSGCSASYVKKNCSANSELGDCESVFNVSDNFIKISEKICDVEKCNADGDCTSSGRWRATECNCITEDCTAVYTYTVTDNAGNTTVNKFTYYHKYDDWKTWQNNTQYCP